jgi:hypothetical protein
VAGEAGAAKELLGEEGESSERGFVRWGENRKLGVCVLCVLVVEYTRELVYSIRLKSGKIESLILLTTHTSRQLPSPNSHIFSSPFRLCLAEVFWQDNWVLF